LQQHSEKFTAKSADAKRSKIGQQSAKLEAKTEWLHVTQEVMSLIPGRAAVI